MKCNRVALAYSREQRVQRREYRDASGSPGHGDTDVAVGFLEGVGLNAGREALGYGERFQPARGLFSTTHPVGSP